jgi:DNA polymerase/3'-5' exonuclease PolX
MLKLDFNKSNKSTIKYSANTENHNENITNQLELLIDYIKKTNKLEEDSNKKRVNQFRIKHLEHALSVIRLLDYELTLNNLNSLNMPGIGAGTISRVEEILKSGNLKELSELKKIVSNKNIDIISELNDVIGIGDKRAIELIKKYKIKSVKELKDKVDNGIIEVNDKIKLGLKYYGKYKTNIPRDEINQIYIYIDNIIRNLDNRFLFFICGSYRRGNLTSGDVDILLLHEDVYFQEEVPETDYLTKVVNRLKEKKFLLDDLTETDGGTKYMGFCKYKNNPVRRIDIRMMGLQSFVPALAYFTGSYELNQKMRALAKEQGYKLNEYGLYDNNGNNILLTSEEELFETLGLDYLDPEER